MNGWGGERAAPHRREKGRTKLFVGSPGPMGERQPNGQKGLKKREQSG